VEKVSIDTAIETPNEGKEKKKADRGRIDQRKDDEGRGEEEGGTRPDNPDVCHPQSHQKQGPLPHKQEQLTAVIVIAAVATLVVVFEIVAIGI
jgi:hypothetical protein